MSFNTFPELNYDDFTWFKDNSIYGDAFGFDGTSWDQSDVAGPSQPYTGVDVFGDYNNYPEFPSPPTPPISLNPTYGMLPEEGKSYRTSRCTIVQKLTSVTGYQSPFYQGSAMPSFHPQPVATPSPPPVHPPFNPPSPIPTLSYGCECLLVTEQLQLLTCYEKPTPSPPNCTAPPSPPRTTHTPNPRSFPTRMIWVMTSPPWQGPHPCPRSTFHPPVGHPTRNVS